MPDRAGPPGTGRDPVAGKIIEVVEIPARHGAAVEVARGQVLRVIDVEGAQVGDLVCFNRHDLGESYSPQNTVLYWRASGPGGSIAEAEHAQAIGQRERGKLIPVLCWSRSPISCTAAKSRASSTNDWR